LDQSALCFFVLTDRSSDKPSEGKDTACTSSQSVGQWVWVERRLEWQVSQVILSIASCLEFSLWMK